MHREKSNDPAIEDTYLKPQWEKLEKIKGFWDTEMTPFLFPEISKFNGFLLYIFNKPIINHIYFC